MALTPPPATPVPAAPSAPGDAPSRANPTTFRSLADAFVVWLVGFRTSLAGLRTWLADYMPWAATHVEELNALQLDVTSKQGAASTAASTASSKAGEASASASNAAASRAAIDNRIYPGSYAADPLTRPDGSPVQAGDVYFTTANVAKVYGSGVWAQVPGASAADLANSVDPAKGAALLGWDGVNLASHLKDRAFRRVADVAALRALDKTKYTAAVVATYAADTGAAAGLYLYDATDTTSAESLPYLVVATDGGRWRMQSPMEPTAQDLTPIAQLTRDQGDRYGRPPLRQLAVSADNGAVNLELPLHIGTRRNLWMYTEAFSDATRYQTTNATKQADTITVDGITLTRLSCSNFYSNFVSNFSGLGLTPFVAGELYLFSFYVLNRGEAENFFWMRSLALSSSPGHGAKLAPPGRLRRVWQVKKAKTTSTVAPINTPTNALGADAAENHWFQMGPTEGGAMEVYVGGFMFEKLASNTYKDGIALIGDSTMEGASGVTDLPNSREVSTWLGALLNVNVFNRANGGERLDQMDARWATDITPLAVNCKYAVIQGGINDVGQGIRTLADMQASVNSMAAKALADGLLDVYFTCTPTESIGANPAKESLRLQFNTWLKATFPRVVDIAAVVQDPHRPSTLRRAKGWYGDGTHYGPQAKRAVAAYVAQWTGWDFVPPSPYQAIPAAVYAAPGAALTHNGLQVVGPRETGWTAGTGTPNKGAFAADTATAVQAAQRLLALEQALRTHGLIA